MCVCCLCSVSAHSDSISSCSVEKGQSDFSKWPCRKHQTVESSGEIKITHTQIKCMFYDNLYAEGRKINTFLRENMKQILFPREFRGSQEKKKKEEKMCVRKLHHGNIFFGLIFKNGEKRSWVRVNISAKLEQRCATSCQK